MFSKKRYRAEIKNTFSFGDLELVLYCMILNCTHVTSSSHKQSLCEVITLNVSQKKGTRHKLCTFPSSDLALAQMALGQNHDTP